MELNPIFCSHMLHQAGKPVSFFGTGVGHVSVLFRGDTKEADSAEGKWLVELPARDYGGPGEMKINLGGDEIELTDIYIGEVYLLAGQSNMQFKLKNSTTPAADYRGNPLLRLFTLDRLENNEFFHARDGWVTCDKECAGNWSAIGYHLGQLLTAKKGITIGLIACYQGASVIESWIPEEILKCEKFNIPLELKFADHTAPIYYAWNRDGILYHAMFEKLIPFSMSHVVWYQGESNATELEGTIYAEMLAAMIKRWREDLLDRTLPFIVIQIADYPRRGKGWKAIQAAQLEVLNITENVITVISADICENDNIHPPTKTKLAERIAEIL
jgi:sialate O-acetylesterase